MADLFTFTCDGCIHYQGQPDSEQGTCWRYPPTPIPVMQPPPQITIATPEGAAPPGPGFGVVSVRAPVTASTPACGEYETPEEAGEETPAPGGTD